MPAPRKMGPLRRSAFLILLLAVTETTSACDCVLTDVKEAVKRADAVVAGTVVSVQDMEITPLNVFTHFKLFVRRVEVVVERAFKGRMVSDTLVVYTAVEGTECGFEFLNGQRYIIYGDRDQEQFQDMHVTCEKPLYGRGTYWTNTCTRTRLYDEAEVKELEALK